MRNFGPTNPCGTTFALKQCLYQKEATGMVSLKMYYNYPISWGAVRAKNGNMRRFGPTIPHGTLFALKQWLYQK